MTLRHTGFANDVVAGSMNGGKIILRLPEHLSRGDFENSILGNSCAYGATAGHCMRMERLDKGLGVRNSGAVIVTPARR